MFTFATSHAADTSDSTESISLEDRHCSGRLDELVDFIDHNSLRTYGAGISGHTRSVAQEHDAGYVMRAVHRG